MVLWPNTWPVVTFLRKGGTETNLNKTNIAYISITLYKFTNTNFLIINHRVAPEGIQLCVLSHITSRSDYTEYDASIMSP